MEKEAHESDILSQYKAISTKLKKRFLKKPNIAEGSEQFAGLAKQLKVQESFQYAGFCHLAQARCEHTLGNASGEAHALTEAARSFMEAERCTLQLHCPGFQEHLNAAINCYSHAIRVHLEDKQCPLAAALSIELGNALKALGKPGESIQHYQRAAELQLQSPLDCLTSLGYIASAKIETNDFEGALSVFTEISYLAQERGAVTSGGQPIGAFCDVLTRCEVSRVLLLMLLQPTPQRIRPEHAQTLEKYAWESKEEDLASSYLGEDLFLLLQSVVLACQTSDIDSLRSLQTELWPLMSAELNHLLHLVIEEIHRPAGQGL